VCNANALSLPLDQLIHPRPGSATTLTGPRG